MKKIFYSILVALTVMSCGNKSNQNAPEQNDSTTVAETTEQAETVSFGSLDYQTFNLRGSVASVGTYINDDESEEPLFFMGFDEAGRLNKYHCYTIEDDLYINYSYPDDKQSLDGKVLTEFEFLDADIDFRILRDDKGRITHYNRDFYEYDAQGRICKCHMQGTEGEDSYVYTEFNEHGDPVKGTFEAAGEGEEWSGTVEYTYLNYDQQGNWTKRNVHKVYAEEGMGELDDIYIRHIQYR